MRAPQIAGLCVVLLVPACAPAGGPSGLQRATTASRYDPPIPSDQWQWMAKISAEYRADNGLVADIKNCYYENGVGSTAWLYKYQGLRTCLYLDYTGYRANEAMTANFRAPGDPFFSRAQAAARWKFFGPKAGYPSRAAMLRSMSSAYAVIKPMLTDVVPRFASSTTYVVPARPPPPGPVLPGLAPAAPGTGALPPPTVFGQTEAP